MEEEEAVAPATVAEAASGTATTRVEEAGRPTRKPPALKVVAAVDASEESLYALSWALDNIVRGHPDAALVVEHFVYPVAGHAVAYAPTTALESMRKDQEAVIQAFLRSVSDYLTHHASCPVLAVKPPKAHAK